MIELLWEAVQGEKLALVQAILRDNPRINLELTSKNKNNALLLAIEVSDVQMIEFLLEAGANPNPEPDKVWALPLGLAVDYAVEIMKNNSAMIEEPTEIIRLLLDYGADILTQDNNGFSAYDYAYGTLGHYNCTAQRIFDEILGDDIPYDSGYVNKNFHL